MHLDVILSHDSYRFALMPNRNFSSPDYRYGFNGMEKDDEMSSNGNSYDFGARMYNPRLGRWNSIDSKTSKHPDKSPYIGIGNIPTIFNDPDGNDISYEIIENEGGTPIIVVTISGKVIDLSNGIVVTANKVAQDLSVLGFFSISSVAVDVSELKLGFHKAHVFFNYDFDVAESMEDVNPEDHLVVLADFDYDLPGVTILAEGIVTGRGGKTAFVKAGAYSDIENALMAYGGRVALHEAWTHFFALGHPPKGTKGTSLRKSGGYFFGVTDGDVVNALKNLKNGKLNQGTNSFIASDGYKYPLFKFDFYDQKKGRWIRPNVKEAGVDTRVVRMKSRNKSSKAKKKNKRKKYKIKGVKGKSKGKKPKGNTKH